MSGVDIPRIHNTPFQIDGKRESEFRLLSCYKGMEWRVEVQELETKRDPVDIWGVTSMSRTQSACRDHVIHPDSTPYILNLQPIIGRCEHHSVANLFIVGRPENAIGQNREAKEPNPTETLLERGGCALRLTQKGSFSRKDFPFSVACSWHTHVQTCISVSFLFEFTQREIDDSGALCLVG